MTKDFFITANLFFFIAQKINTFQSTKNISLVFAEQVNLHENEPKLRQ
jgi:hypothetical protein